MIKKWVKEHKWGILSALFFISWGLFAFLVGYWTGTGDLQKTLPPIVGGV